MPQACFAVPGDLATPTGGYVYARRLIAALAEIGWSLDVVALPGSFPLPSPEELKVAEDTLAALSADRPLLIDGLAFGVLDRDFLTTLPQPLVALVHHPLALEVGLPPGQAERFKKQERAALAEARQVVVTSASTARCLAQDYGVPRGRIAVAEPGTDPGVRAQGGGSVPRLLTVATLTPRKGHDLLVRALARLTHLSWEALWVGSTERDPQTAMNLRRAIRAEGLEGRIVLAGSLPPERLADCYCRADIFVLPSRHEGFGMAFAEALAHGLPVVGCAAGAVPETVPAEAGILVPPDDLDALTEALSTLLRNHLRRQAMADAAWRHAVQQPRWQDTAAHVAAALAKAMVPRSPRP